MYDAPPCRSEKQQVGWCPVRAATITAKREDCRDDLIEYFAYQEACLLEQVIDLTSERDAYRCLAQQALHQLHTVTLERDLLRGQRALDLRRAREQRQTEANHGARL